MPPALETHKPFKTAHMVSDELSILLRAILVISGATGFVLGIGLGLWREMSLLHAFLRGAILCAIFAFVARGLSMALFRAHIRRLSSLLKEGKIAKKAPKT